MAKLGNRQPFDQIRIIPLAWHVDYWNHLGWKDPYSSAEFSNRQRWYSELLDSRSYTPQMVVNGRTEFVGSAEGRARAVIRNQSKLPVDIDLEWRENDANASKRLLIEWNAPEGLFRTAEHELRYAVTEDQLETEVKAGENAGKTLSHVAVVRRYETVGQITKKRPTDTKKINIRAKSGWDQTNLDVVVFVQSTNSGRVKGVNTIPFTPDE